MSKHKGTLIVFEGPEGVGKSTQAIMLNDWLRKNIVVNRGSPSRLLCVPGSPDLGLCRDIRQMLFKRDYSKSNDALIQGLLFFIDNYRNSQYAKHLIGQGTHAVSDRWNPYSKLAYEVLLPHPTPKWILDVFRHYGKHLIQPDIAFLIDYHPQVGKERSDRPDKQVQQSDKPWASADMNVALRKVYLEMAARWNWCVIRPIFYEDAQQVFERYVLPVVAKHMVPKYV